MLFDPVNRVTLQPPLGVWRVEIPTLQPEKTDAYSAGIVWTPKFLPGFTMTADWYQLFTTDLILSRGDFAQVLLLSSGVVDPDGCGDGSGCRRMPGWILLTASALSAMHQAICSVSIRRPATPANVLCKAWMSLRSTNCRLNDCGKFTLSGGWNHFFTWKAQADPATGFTNFLGNYNNGTLPLAPGAIPWNKGFLRGEWQWRNFDFVATGNYIGDFQDDPASSWQRRSWSPEPIGES